MKAKKKRNTFLNGLIWSSKGIAASVPSTLIVTYLAFYATNVLGIKATIVASMLLFTKLIDGVTDVISGVVIDNTHTRFGKGRPYDWCILLMGIFTILLFSAPQSGLTVQIIYLAIMYVMVQAVFSTLLETGDAVYLLRAFPVEKERNTVFSIGVIVSQLFSITIDVILPILIASAGTDHAAWTKMVAMVMVPAAAIGMLRFFLVKEVVVDDAQKEVSEDKKVEKKEEKISFKEAAKSIFENPYILVFAAAIFVVVIASGLMNASISCIFKHPLKKDLYIAMADRWVPEFKVTKGVSEKIWNQIVAIYMQQEISEEDREWFEALPMLETANTSIADYVWLPLKFDGDKASIEWRDEWSPDEFEDADVLK